MDVEMKDIFSFKKNVEKIENFNGVGEEEFKKDFDFLILEDIREYVRYIEKAVVIKELRYVFRVIRGLVLIRRRLNLVVLRKFL